MAETAPPPNASELLQHTDWLTQLARALVGDANAADVVQETYEVALAKPPKQPGALRPWLGGVARNLARMTSRGRVRRERREEATLDLAPQVPTPAELVERAQMQQRVANVVLELPEPLRATLLLRFFEGMSAADIARAQGIPDATVRGRIKDALDRVRATLDQHGRKRWIALLAPLPVVPAAPVAGLVGGLAVKSGTKVAIALVVVILAVLGTRWLGWWGGGGGQPGTGSGSNVATTPGSNTAPVVKPTVVAATGGSSRQQVPVFDDDPRGTLRLEGQVIDEKDAPVGGAQVAIDAHPTIIVTTEADGSFTFEGLMPRDYRLEATGGEGYAGPARLRLTEKTEPVTLRMRKAGLVEVLVTGNEKPVANADVELRSTLTWKAKTDAKGVAQLRGVGSVWAPLAVSAAGFAPAAIMLSTSGDPAMPARVSIALSRGAPLSGRVVDAQGKPIGEARVVATSASEPFPVVDPRRDGVLTKADGTFAIPTVASGTWRVTASQGEHAPATSPPITVDGVHARDGVELVLVLGGTLKGKVVDHNGNPLAAAEVRAVASGHIDWRARRQALTATDGSFSLTGLPQRELDVLATHDAGASAIAKVDLSVKSTAEVTLTLDVTGEIAGVVVDKTGQPIGDAQVIAEPEWSGGIGDRAVWSVRGIQEAVTDQGGLFRLTGMPDGNYRVRAARPGSTEAELSLATPVIAQPGGAKVRITIAGDGKIVGKVALDGKAPARFFVSVGDYGMPFSSADGAFVLPLAAGKHVVSIRGPGFVEKWVRDVEVADGKATDMGTIAVAAGRSISGRVLDTTGAPVAKAKVAAGALLTGGGKELYLPDESIGAKDTDSDDHGRFSIEGFNHGPLTVVAGKDGAGRTASIRIPPGHDSVTLELVLQPTTGLDGKVVRDGKPASDTVIIANPIGATASNFFTTTGPDGTFALDAIAPGAYVVYPMFGGGGPKPKDMYTRRVEVVTGKRGRVDIDATPGALALAVSVKGADGAAAMAQVIVIQAAVEVANLDELRDGAMLPFGEVVIPIYIRGHMGGPVEITGMRPGKHTACAMGMGTMGIEPDLSKMPFKCAQLELAPGAPKKTLELLLPKPKT